MTLNEEIEFEVLRIRELGVTDRLRVVPIVNKRCFAPCGVGRCNCYPTIRGKFCLVTQDSRQHALDDANRELAVLEDIMERFDNEKH